MKAFDYVAANARGKLVNGTAWATSELDLDHELENKGLVLTRAKVVADEKQGRALKLGREELINLTNQLATVTGAGVPIVEGLAGIGARMPSQSSRQLVEEMVSALQGGESLSRVMSAYPRTFPPVYRASVLAGEASGSLERVLNRLSSHLEWVRAMRATTIQALIYPAILCLAIAGLITILLSFVLPRIVGMFPGGIEDLPRETRIVMAISGFLTGNFILLTILGVACAFGLSWAMKTVRGRRILDRIVLRIPRLGTVAAQIATTKFACTASILQAAGCDVFTVLDISAATCGNAAMGQAFQRAANRVRRGASISESLEREPLVDSLLVQLISVGEKTGELDKCLERLVQHYDDEVPRNVKRFLALLEPALLLAAGGVVAFILLAALTPIFDLYQSMG